MSISLDPKIIAEMSIYCIGFFGFGFFVSWIIQSKLKKTARKNFASEKEKFENEKNVLLETKKKYELLCVDIEKNEEYWLYKKQTTASNEVDPSEILSDGLKKM